MNNFKRRKTISFRLANDSKTLQSVYNTNTTDMNSNIPLFKIDERSNNKASLINHAKNNDRNSDSDEESEISSSSVSQQSQVDKTPKVQNVKLNHYTMMKSQKSPSKVPNLSLNTKETNIKSNDLNNVNVFQFCSPRLGSHKQTVRNSPSPIIQSLSNSPNKNFSRTLNRRSTVCHKTQNFHYSISEILDYQRKKEEEEKEKQNKAERVKAEKLIRNKKWVNELNQLTKDRTKYKKDLVLTNDPQMLLILSNKVSRVNKRISRLMSLINGGDEGLTFDDNGNPYRTNTQKKFYHRKSKNGLTEADFAILNSPEMKEDMEKINKYLKLEEIMHEIKVFQITDNGVNNQNLPSYMFMRKEVPGLYQPSTERVLNGRGNIQCKRYKPVGYKTKNNYNNYYNFQTEQDKAIEDTFPNNFEDVYFETEVKKLKSKQYLRKNCIYGVSKDQIGKIENNNKSKNKHLSLFSKSTTLNKNINININKNKNNPKSRNKFEKCGKYNTINSTTLKKDNLNPKGKLFLRSSIQKNNNDLSTERTSFTNTNTIYDHNKTLNQTNYMTLNNKAINNVKKYTKKPIRKNDLVMNCIRPKTASIINKSKRIINDANIIKANILEKDEERNKKIEQMMHADSSSNLKNKELKQKTEYQKKLLQYAFEDNKKKILVYGDNEEEFINELDKIPNTCKEAFRKCYKKILTNDRLLNKVDPRFVDPYEQKMKCINENKKIRTETLRNMYILKEHLENGKEDEIIIDKKNFGNYNTLKGLNFLKKKVNMLGVKSVIKGAFNPKEKLHLNIHYPH